MKQRQKTAVSFVTMTGLAFCCTFQSFAQLRTGPADAGPNDPLLGVPTKLLPDFSRMSRTIYPNIFGNGAAPFTAANNYMSAVGYFRWRALQESFMVSNKRFWISREEAELLVYLMDQGEHTRWKWLILEGNTFPDDWQERLKNLREQEKARKSYR